MDDLTIKFVETLGSIGVIGLVVVMLSRYAVSPIIDLLKQTTTRIENQHDRYAANDERSQKMLERFADIAEKQQGQIEKIAEEQRRASQVQEFLVKNVKSVGEGLGKSQDEIKSALDDTKHKITESFSKTQEVTEKIANAAHSETRNIIKTESEEIQEALSKVINSVVSLSEGLVKLTNSANDSRVSLDNAIQKSASQSERRHEIMQQMIRTQAEDFQKITQQLMDVQAAGSASMSATMGQLLATLLDMNEVVKKAIELPKRSEVQVQGAGEISSN